jgi:hypothetical protein
MQQRMTDILDEEVLRGAGRPSRLTLSVEVTDPEVLAELDRIADRDERERYATAALRLGVLALKTAAGQVDAASIRDAGREVVGEVRELLSTRAVELSERISGTLSKYLDPATGLLPQRMQSLVAKDGELARVLQAHLGADGSVLAKTVTALLGEQKNEVLKQFSLDHKDSALSRLVAEIEEQLEALARRNAEFHGEVRTTLAALQAQREEAARSTRHGVIFEEQLGQLIRAEAQRLTDEHEATGATTGAIRHCKTGDHVVELGPDSQAPGARIVWEAKEDRSYDLRQARREIEEARKNRQAQLGVFVFSRKTAPEGLIPFARYGDDLIVVWDAEEPASDVVVRAAYSCARALAVKTRIESKQAAAAVNEIDRAVRAVEKQVQYLDQIHTMAETVRSSGQKILERSERMRDDLAREVARLDEAIGALRTG